MDLQSALFDDCRHDIIPWLRLPHFQDLVLVLIAERILEALTASRYSSTCLSLAATDYLVGPARVYVSKHNEGAMEVTMKLLSYFKKGSEVIVVDDAAELRRAYFSKSTRKATPEKRNF